MNASTTDAYRARFQRVREHIDAHLGEDLSVLQLCRIAAFSKFHFHRQFAALFGVSVHRYVQLARLKRASYELAFRANRSVLQIALESGYEGPEAFARALKKTFGQSPSGFRAKPDWARWHEAYAQLDPEKITPMTTATNPREVTIIQFKETHVAALEHRGAPQLVGDSVRKFIEWRQQNNLSYKVSATFNIAYDHPEDTPPADYRIDICAATDRPIAPNSQGVVKKTIPGGRCAVLRHVGSDDALLASVTYLYRDWLPQSGEEPRDFPVFFQRILFFPDVPESQATTDIFLPLK